MKSFSLKKQPLFFQKRQTFSKKHWTFSKKHWTFSKKHLSVSGENNGCFKLEKRKVHQSKIKTALKQRYNGI